uniref:Uncharacterized protein n=1 Tax=Romanomermis culicivorax TaxID=13658 RepID=A0A915I1U2_ROMCU
MFAPLVVQFVDWHVDFPSQLVSNRVPNIKCSFVKQLVHQAIVCEKRETLFYAGQQCQDDCTRLNSDLTDID